MCVGIIHTSVADDDASVILSKLEKKYDSIRDASVEFTQNVRFGVTQTEQTFSGKLFMKKGNKYRIELEQQTIVTDGKSVWTYSKLNNQVLIDTYKDDPKSFSPDKVLTNVPDNYNATLLGKEKIQKYETVILKLVPKLEKSNIKWMKIWVDQDEWLMRKIQIQDISDNLTTYSVDSIRLNAALSDSQFQFQAPPNVEVIDLR
jgi:chaperone LolA